MKNVSGKIKYEIVFVVIFVLLSGNIPFANMLFVLNKSYVFLLFAILLLVNILMRQKPIKKKEFYYFLFIISAQTLLTVFQVLKGNDISANVITQFVLFLMAFLLWINLRIKLFTYIPKVVVVLIKISLLFHIPAVILFLLGINILDIIPDFLKFHNSMDFDAEKTHILFHNYRAFAIGDTDKFYRNSGCFWEPGAFGGIIIFASLWFIAGFKAFTVKKRKAIIIWLIIGIFSTQSSAALMLLPVLAIIYEIEKRENIRQLKKFIYIGVPFIIVLSYFMFTNLPVLQEKIVEQFIMVQEEEKFWERTRLGTIIILAVVIKNNPIFGVGFSEHGFANAIYKYLGFEMQGLGNGMFIYIAKAGIPFFILISFLFYNNFRKMYTKKISGIIAIFILLLALQGEAWMEHPIIYLFLFSANVLIKEKRNQTEIHSVPKVSVLQTNTKKTI